MKGKKLKYSIVGFLGVVILLSSYWGFNYLKGTNLFKKTYTYYVVYDRIDGLNTSAPVTVNGFKVGQVDRIELLPGHEGLLKVTISVRQEIKIPLGSTARIYSMDLMGSRGIEMIFTESDNHHKPEDTLIADIEKTLKEEVNLQMLPLKNQAEDLMAEIQNAIEIITYIFNPETRDNLEKTFESIRRTFLHLEGSAGSLESMIAIEANKINAILNNVASITDNLARNNKQITNILNNISIITDSIAAANILSTINNANDAIANFNSVVDKINSGEGTMGMLINDDKLYKDLDNAAKSLDKLLEDLRLNPKKYVNFSLVDRGRAIYVIDESEIPEKELKKMEKQQRKDERRRERNIKKEGKEEDKNDKNESDDTSYIIYDEDIKNENNNEIVYFMIQILSGKNKLKTNSSVFKGHSDIVEVQVNGFYKYLTGLHYDTEHTNLYLEIIREDFPDAFAVAFSGNDLISYTRGKNLLSNP